ncbi:ABC transporter ATP-binding protein [Pleomorphomonas oryzae]|uniref:ABC transporter ATP-binding protein n=1 Tax=Pleomorphomonas oryzae TaxID=261934 RepID=UPI00041D55CF|nr:ABC transporter ATP-binding protein [Pleomorphomonas oryzae]
MMDDGALLTIEAASQSYDGKRWQFRNLDLSLRAGEITAVLGPNGRGKSTLLRVLAGLLTPTTARRLDLNPRTGFVPQAYFGSFPYTVLDVVLMGRARHIALFRMPGKDDVEKAMAALDATGMADFAGRGIDALSGGERQLVLIARALAGDNAVLLLDEPASALDLKNQDAVLTLLSELADRHRIAIAFTTHQPNHAITVADNALIMLEGDTLFGPIGDVLTEANLKALYGLPVVAVPLGRGGARRSAFVPLYRSRDDGGVHD